MNLDFMKTNLRAFTFENKRIKLWVESKCIGKTLNLFSGKTKLNVDEYRVDLSNEFSPDAVLDAYDFIKNTKMRFDTVLLDPPYSYRKGMEYYNGHYTSKFKLIADEIKNQGIQTVISFGYHTTFMGNVRNYELSELLVIGHSGAQHATIAIIENAK